MTGLLTTIISSRGKVNYINLSRFSDLNEKTFRRWFKKSLDFIEFNRIGNSLAIPEEAVKIGVIDSSFNNKSGYKSYGLGKFWNSKQGKAEKGQEISTLAVVDVDYNTAYHVSTRQTPPESAEGETRVHGSVRHLKEDGYALPKDVRYIVTDAY